MSNLILTEVTASAYCNRCEANKPYADFYFRSDNSGKLHSYCKQCTGEIARKSRGNRNGSKIAKQVLPHLAKFGIPAFLNANNDIILYGCLRVLVKNAIAYSNTWKITFTVRERKQKYDIIMVVGLDKRVVCIDGKEPQLLNSKKQLLTSRVYTDKIATYDILEIVEAKLLLRIQEIAQKGYKCERLLK